MPTNPLTDFFVWIPRLSVPFLPSFLRLLLWNFVSFCFRFQTYPSDSLVGSVERHEYDYAQYVIDNRLSPTDGVPLRVVGAILPTQTDLLSFNFPPPPPLSIKNRKREGKTGKL